jgi:ABC-type multidrug transport system ATPase subunit
VLPESRLCISQISLSSPNFLLLMGVARTRLLQISGDITYNGHGLNEFVPQRTSAYVSQQDWHASEMTVRETLEFAGRFQGVGIKYGMSPR